ncbi:MAG: hypothetical protein KJO42_13295, partial [Silicimonas sp.]|nr:hypothetical protein [Silicimonas sp.]
MTYDAVSKSGGVRFVIRNRMPQKAIANQTRANPGCRDNDLNKSRVLHKAPHAPAIVIHAASAIPRREIVRDCDGLLS